MIEVGGFDVGPDGIAYFAGIAVPATAPALYAVDLATGQADLIGLIGESASIESIAVGAGSPWELSGGTADDKFARVDIFQAQSYGLSTFEGLEPNESIAAMDFARSLYVPLGLSNQGRLYTVYDWRVNEVRLPNVPVAAFSGTSFGMDFDPNLDALRVVTNTGENVRVDPSTAMLVSVDQSLAYAAGDVNEGASPNVVALAYTERFSDIPRSTAYAIDATRDQLLRLGGLHGSPSANTGVLTTVGDLGVDVGDDAAFDITPGGMALLTSGTEILTVNLATGETRRTSNASVPHLSAIAIWPQQNPGF